MDVTQLQYSAGRGKYGSAKRKFKLNPAPLPVRPQRLAQNV